MKQNMCVLNLTASHGSATICAVELRHVKAVERTTDAAALPCTLLLVNSASQRLSAKNAKRGKERETVNARPSGCSAMKMRVVHKRTLDTSWKRKPARGRRPPSIKRRNWRMT
jgi:hypothetical protein